MPELTPCPAPSQTLARTAVASLTEMQRIVLDVVNRHTSPGSGCSTNWVASFIGRQPGKESNRKHSAMVSEVLHELESLGRIRRKDGRSNISWCRKD